MRDTMTLPAILDDCLQRLQAGETVAACLDRYPDQASELAPLLTAAARLRPLAGQRLSDAQRAQGRAAVRAAARTQVARAAQPGRGPGWGWMKSRAFGLAVAALAVVLVLALAGTTVLASQPGDVGYPLRVVAERAPAALQPSPAGRADAELRIADRRLDDLESHLRATRRVEAAALAALIRGDEAAACRAIDLPEIERRLVAERIERHAAAILRLADRAATPAIAIRLRQVANRMELVATRLRLGKPLPERRNQTGLVPSATETATEQPAWTATPTARHCPRSPLGRLRFQRRPDHADTDATPALPTEPPATAQPDAPAATSTATSQPGRTDTATPTQAITSSPTPVATAGATTIVRPSRTPRPPLTPQPSRTPRPSLTPRPVARRDHRSPRGQLHAETTAHPAAELHAETTAHPAAELHAETTAHPAAKSHAETTAHPAAATVGTAQRDTGADTGSDHDPSHADCARAAADPPGNANGRTTARGEFDSRRDSYPRPRHGRPTAPAHLRAPAASHTAA